jgi:hypothetical protein
MPSTVSTYNPNKVKTTVISHHQNLSFAVEGVGIMVEYAVADCGTLYSLRILRFYTIGCRGADILCWFGTSVASNCNCLRCIRTPKSSKFGFPRILEEIKAMVWEEKEEKMEETMMQSSKSSPFWVPVGPCVSFFCPHHHHDWTRRLPVTMVIPRRYR